MSLADYQPPKFSSPVWVEIAAAVRRVLRRRRRIKMIVFLSYIYNRPFESFVDNSPYRETSAEAIERMAKRISELVDELGNSMHPDDTIGTLNRIDKIARSIHSRAVVLNDSTARTTDVQELRHAHD